MIRKILVANRGEIAIRIIRACKELEIGTVAIHSDVDRESLHVKLADESVCIGPAKATESYLRIPAILSAAHLTEVDAIHPGYGFLAENSEFAEVCDKSKITFIGPDAKSIKLMGNKIAARQAMEKAGVPVLPGCKAETTDSDRLMSAATDIGYPIIVKAAFGGGGRGMKIVHTPGELMQAVSMAKTEASTAFGNDTVYLEKYVQSSRHVEFQIAADRKGHVVCFGERDCTVQRRHQKLIEEAPSPAVDAKLRKEMTTILNRAMKKIDYTNVGTVEFLLDEQGKLYFMEMNTRIQVEHPVTEMVTGVDLIKLQIALAAGEKLDLSQEDMRLNGHSIECRINAEDPIKFRPSVGTIEDYHVPGGFGVRVDSSLYDGYKVLPFYDSLLAKLIVHAKTRDEAIKKMQSALSELVVNGIQCNAEFHKRVLASDQFQSGNFDTSLAQYITVN